MSNLPLEIQQHIRRQVPKFTRLSRNDYVGEDILIEKCYSPVTEEEILHYLQEFNVESFIIFSQDDYHDNLFNIDLFQLNEPVGDVLTALGIFFKSKTYRRIRYVLNMEEDFFEVVTHFSTWYNRVRVDDVMKDYNQFYCDIVTSYDIVKHLRKECDIIPQFNKKFVQHSIDNIIKINKFNRHWRKDEDYDLIFSKIIKTIYLFTNYFMLMQNYEELNTTFTRFNGILRLITFDKYNNIITTTDLLDREYNLYLTKLYKYTADNL